MKCAAVCAFLFLAASAASAVDTAKLALPLSERAYIASRVYASLVNFAHWQNVPNLDIEAAYRTYLDYAIASQDRAAFTRATMEFLAKLHNAHTTLFDQTLMQQSGPLPFQAELLDGQWVVTKSWVAGLGPGDIIETLNGRSFDHFTQDCLRFVSGSTEAGSRRLLYARLGEMMPNAQLFPKRFLLALAGGRKVAVDRDALQPMAPLATEGRWIDPGKRAYIRVPSFFGTQFEKRALELAHDFRDAAALIIDVRGNCGGATPEALTAFLMDRPYRWWTEAVPLKVPFFQFRSTQGHDDYQLFNRAEITWPAGPQQPPKEHFSGKLILLADAGCMSACEDFVMPFKDSHRAQILGETTSGSSGQPYIADLGDGFMVFIGAKRELFPDGSPFEGAGIQPDVHVIPGADDLRLGRDRALEAAERLTR